MENEKITSPEQALSLSAQELFRRLKPLLRNGGLCASSAQLARVEQNLSSACWELGQAWRANPRLHGRPVGFDDYLAATLCYKLRALDREQNPDLYDSHRKYQAAQEPLYLDQFDSAYFPLPATAPPSREPVPTAWTRALIAAAGRTIAQASIAALIQRVTDVENGKTRTPYRLARQEGLSTTEARYQPATGPFLAIREYLGEYTPTAVATSGI